MRGPRRRIPLWFVAVTVAVGAARLRELRTSARHEAEQGGVRAAPRSYPIMVAAHAALFVLPLLEVSTAKVSVRPHWRWTGVLVGATLLRVWSIRSLGSSWNVRGTVPTHLHPVRSGPYAYIRHPNYLAVIAEFASLPMIAGAYRAALGLSLVNALLLIHRIREEERLLFQSGAYRRAFRDVPRFIPRWGRRPPRQVHQL